MANTNRGFKINRRGFLKLIGVSAGFGMVGPVKAEPPSKGVEQYEKKAEQPFRADAQGAWNGRYGRIKIGSEWHPVDQCNMTFVGAPRTPRQEYGWSVYTSATYYNWEISVSIPALATIANSYFGKSIPVVLERAVGYGFSGTGLVSEVTQEVGRFGESSTRVHIVGESEIVLAGKE